MKKVVLLKLFWPLASERLKHDNESDGEFIPGEKFTILVANDFTFLYNSKLFSNSHNVVKWTDWASDVFKKSANLICTILKLHITGDLFIFYIYLMVIGKVDFLFSRWIS